MYIYISNTGNNHRCYPAISHPMRHRLRQKKNRCSESRCNPRSRSGHRARWRPGPQWWKGGLASGQR